MSHNENILHTSKQILQRKRKQGVDVEYRVKHLPINYIVNRLVNTDSTMEILRIPIGKAFESRIKVEALPTSRACRA